MADRPVLDLRDAAFLADPGPVLARIRAEGELVRVRLPIMGPVWLTTSDAGARELLKDRERVSRDPRQAGKPDVTRLFWWMPRFMHPLMKNMVISDGEAHARLRGLVDKAFARTEIEALRPEIEAIADMLLDGLDPGRPVEIVSAYTRRLPLLVICALLGVPDADRERIARWIAPISGPTAAWRIFAALPGLRRTLRHFRADFAEVRRTGRPGLIRELVAVEAEGDRLSEDELLAMVFTLFVAGHETTVHLITDAILGLIDRPEWRVRVAAGGPEAALAVEEFMRFYSPVMMTKGMYAVRDFEFRGVKVKRGEVLSALLLAANHDPARFEAPGEMRPDRRPNAHLGFGHGPHVCLGMQLARAEAQVALARLFGRFPDLALAGARSEVRFGRRLGVRGLPRLELRLGG